MVIKKTVSDLNKRKYSFGRALFRKLEIPADPVTEKLGWGGQKVVRFRRNGKPNSDDSSNILPFHFSGRNRLFLPDPVIQTFFGLG